MFSTNDKLVESVVLVLPRGSIKLIAETLGLATLTVSNCLRNKPNYSKATKAKVLKEAKAILEGDIEIKQGAILNIEKHLKAA